MFGKFCFGNVDIGQCAYGNQASGSNFEARHFACLKDAADGLQFAPKLFQLFAVQGIAAAQMMVEEGKRRADGEGVQPEGGFCQFNRHRVFVDAEDVSFQNHAADDMAVIQLRVGYAPAVFPRRGFDAFADVGNARDERALPGAVLFDEVRSPFLFAYAVFGNVDGFKDAVGKVINQRDQKMPAAHCRVANGELGQGAGRVKGVQRIPIARIKGGFTFEFFDFFGKALMAFICQTPD